MLTKKELRNNIRFFKQSQSEHERNIESQRVIEKLTSSLIFKNSSVILAYWAMNNEVQTQTFIENWRHQKKILLPVIDGDCLLIKEYEGYDSMKMNENFKLLEPIGPVYKELDKIDLIIVPGIAFDKKNNRLGRGKGFYDRLLGSNKSTKIGLAFSFQMVDFVPTESHDIPLNLVLHP